MKIYFATMVVAIAAFPNFVELSPMLMHQAQRQGSDHGHVSGTGGLQVAGGRTSQAVLFYKKNNQYHEILNAHENDLVEYMEWWVGKEGENGSYYPLYNKKEELVWQFRKEPIIEEDQIKPDQHELEELHAYEKAVIIRAGKLRELEKRMD